MSFKLINLAIVDDHTLFRKTLTNYLSEQKDINVAIQTASVNELLTGLKIKCVDVLIIDISVAGEQGYEALKSIRAEYPAIKTIVLSMSADIDLISDLLDCGIHGYISKNDEPEDLVKAIVAASESRIYRNRLFTEGLYLNRENNMGFQRDELYTVLNEREIRIIQLIWDEKSSKEIGDELFLGVRSVEKIRQDIKEKLGVKSVIGMLKYAIYKGIIKVNWRSVDRVSQKFNQ